MTKLSDHLKDCPECNKPFAMCPEGMLLLQNEGVGMNREEMIRRQAEGMRALSAGEIEDMREKQASGMRALSLEEIARRHGAGMQNLYTDDQVQPIDTPQEEESA